MNLYELTGQLLQLQEMMEDETLDAETLADTIEGVQGEFDLKIENCAKAIKNLEAKAEALKKESTRLSNRANGIEKNVERLKAYMFDSLKAVKRNKVESDLFTISINKKGGKLPLVIDVEDLPESLTIVKREPNKVALRELLESGKECQYAHLEERGEYLKIK